MKTLKGALPLLALALTSQLHAQPADPTAPTTGGASASAGGSAGATVRLTSAEMQSAIGELEAQIRVDTQHVQHLQAQARKEKDVIKLSCVNDKMIKLKVESNLFDQSRMQLTSVLDREDRFTVYPSVTAAADRVHKLREEADGCVGEPELQPGESGNTFTAPEIPDDPTIGLPFDDVNTGGTVEPPGYASPFS